MEFTTPSRGARVLDAAPVQVPVRAGALDVRRRSRAASGWASGMQASRREGKDAGRIASRARAARIRRSAGALAPRASDAWRGVDLDGARRSLADPVGAPGAGDVAPVDVHERHRAVRIGPVEPQPTS